jgi:hypothetical protein
MGTTERAQLDDDPENTRRLEEAARGDRAACSAVLAQHRERLRRMVALRLDRRLQERVDPSDVIQDAYLEAARRLPEYLREPAPMPPQFLSELTSFRAEAEEVLAPALAEFPADVSAHH